MRGRAGAGDDDGGAGIPRDESRIHFETLDVSSLDSYEQQREYG
jgi:hypothetical protein